MSQELFATVARDWWERFMRRGAAHYANESWRRLEREVLPSIGHKPLSTIDAPQILHVLRRIEARGTLEVAHKLKSHVSQILRYGIACGLIYSNPARDLGWALTPKHHKPRPALTEPRQIGQLMAAIASLDSSPRRAALQFAALTFVRPGELCRAEWSEVEMETGLWRIPAEKMKMKRSHSVPLARQTIALLHDLYTQTGTHRWLFPSKRDATQPMGRRVLNDAIQALGYPSTVMTPHGFRAMAATTLSEEGWNSEVIERQLAHVDKNHVRAAYQRSELLTERRNMMQAWADWLDLRCAWAVLGK